MARQEPVNISSRRIRVTRNGPYLVFGGIPLSGQIVCTDANGECHGWRKGKKLPARDTYALCRCGHSQNRPFCDGTHIQAGFTGTETAARKTYLEQASKIKGPSLELFDARDLCAGAGFCQRGDGTWKLTGRSDDPQAKKAAIEGSCDCPSGRLVVLDDGKPVEPQFEPSICLVEGPQADAQGPIWVRGGVQIESADGTPYEIRNRVTLCRCGNSANKPFCDGSHEG